MKRLHFSIAILFVLCTLFCITCNSSSQNTTTEEQKVDTLDIAGVLNLDTTYVGKEILFKGLIEHTCHRSGMRAFLSGPADASIRVECGDAMPAFSEEEEGQTIVVRGILREMHVEQEKIDEIEAELKKIQETGDEGGHCQSGLQNVANMRNWMKEHGKTYYALYYVDGLSRTVDE